MRAFLCSYFAGVEPAFKNFLRGNPSQQQVVFIPTASTVENTTFYVQDALNVFKNLGLTPDILDIAEVDSETAKLRIEQAEVLYISGGNTFYLLQQLKAKDLINFIAEKVRHGMMYVGESAGAMVASPDIEYARVMDDSDVALGMFNFKALGIVDFYPAVHEEEEPFMQAGRRMKSEYSDKLDLVPINNSRAIRVEGGVRFIV